MENFPSNITDKRTVSYASLRTRHGPPIKCVRAAVRHIMDHAFDKAFG